MTADPNQLTITDHITSTTGGRKMTTSKPARKTTRPSRSRRGAQTPPPVQEGADVQAELARRASQAKSTGQHFTTAGAQRAMDERATSWGYKTGGFYRVGGAVTTRPYDYSMPDGRVVKAKNFRVDVVLYGGRAKVTHIVRFVLDKGAHCYSGMCHED